MAKHKMQIKEINGILVPSPVALAVFQIVMIRKCLIGPSIWSKQASRHHSETQRWRTLVWVHRNWAPRMKTRSRSQRKVLPHQRPQRSCRVTVLTFLSTPITRSCNTPRALPSSLLKTSCPHFWMRSRRLKRLENSINNKLKETSRKVMQRGKPSDPKILWPMTWRLTPTSTSLPKEITSLIRQWLSITARVSKVFVSTR